MRKAPAEGDIFAAPGVLDVTNAPIFSPLDALFDSYHRPALTDGEGVGGDAFLPEVERENAQVLTEFEVADKSQRLKNAKDAVNSGVDYSYFFCVVFVSEEQKQQFLSAVGWEKYGGARFLNGVEMARDMGVALDPAYLATEAHADKKLTDYETERTKNHG